MNEIQKPIVKLRGNFISGSMINSKRTCRIALYSVLFSGLVKHLLAENEEQLAHWKHNILEALGPNGRVITDMIPELEMVIGKQPDIPELDPG